MMAKNLIYQFSDDEKSILATLPSRLILVGTLFVSMGVIRLILGFGSVGSKGWEITPIVLLLIGLVDVFIGITLWRPSDNFMRLVEQDTCGTEQLMTGIEELDKGFRIIQYLGIAAVIFVIINFVVTR